ncbi:hypothetical protein EV643_12592 [Kribbella sp. VKM Ac-2527]|uniref:Uncharacterized protein n=1 Tax=Kribbella caucasensis TaxID=2512215 RepID=A0A4R6JJT8_9ACTN|nr:hypothetical protein EV643_12592 [Kribbella sp. VKM Ac-2527]
MKDARRTSAAGVPATALSSTIPAPDTGVTSNCSSVPSSSSPSRVFAPHRARQTRPAPTPSGPPPARALALGRAMDRLVDKGVRPHHRTTDHRMTTDYPPHAAPTRSVDPNVERLDKPAGRHALPHRSPITANQRSPGRPVHGSRLSLGHDAIRREQRAESDQGRLPPGPFLGGADCEVDDEHHDDGEFDRHVGEPSLEGPRTARDGEQVQQSEQGSQYGAEDRGTARDGARDSNARTYFLLVSTRGGQSRGLECSESEERHHTFLTPAAQWVRRSICRT